MDASGLLLTGGTSRRMGRDKASMDLGGTTLAARAAAALTSVTPRVLVVGHEAGTGLAAVKDRGEGPLAAVVDGAASLGATGPVVVVAADMPFVTAALLHHLVAALGDAGAAVPVAVGRGQPLCAVYASSAIETARKLLADGVRSMHELLDVLPVVVRVAEDEWMRLAPPYALLDVDSPEDFAEAERILDAPA